MLHGYEFDRVEPKPILARQDLEEQVMPEEAVLFDLALSLRFGIPMYRHLGLLSKLGYYGSSGCFSLELEVPVQESHSTVSSKRSGTLVVDPRTANWLT